MEKASELLMEDEHSSTRVKYNTRLVCVISPHSDVFVLQDLLKHTPKDHPDFPLLQDALRISQNFLSSINEEIDPRRTAVTTPKGEVCLNEVVDNQ